MEFHAHKIVIDYEMVFSTSSYFFRENNERFGCTFHFGQSIWRKIQNLGLTIL